MPITDEHRAEAKRLLELDERGQQIELLSFALALHDDSIGQIRKFGELNNEFARNILTDRTNTSFYFPSASVLTSTEPTLGPI